ncbi:hypothetical protein Tco_1506444 [Tanacetum coccineum]
MYENGGVTDWYQELIISEEDPEEDPEEEPNEEPEEDVEIELDNDVELYFLMMWRVTNPRHLEMCHLILCHPILRQRMRRSMCKKKNPRLLLGLLPKSLMPLVPSREVYLRWVSHLLLVTHLIIDDLAPWALRRDLEASHAQARVMEAELGTCQTEIALLKSKNKIGEKERELLNHDLENVERALGNVLERVLVLESRENATLKKRFTETETKLEWARMECDMAERRLHVSQGWNKRFYMEMVRIRVVPKPPSDDEDIERPRKKSKNSPPSGTESLLSHMDHLVTLRKERAHGEVVKVKGEAESCESTNSQSNPSLLFGLSSSQPLMGIGLCVLLTGKGIGAMGRWGKVKGELGEVLGRWFVARKPWERGGMDLAGTMVVAVV